MLRNRRGCKEEEEVEKTIYIIIEWQRIKRI
jgi:hypothetical protein